MDWLLLSENMYVAMTNRKYIYVYVILFYNKIMIFSAEKILITLLLKLSFFKGWFHKFLLVCENKVKTRKDKPLERIREGFRTIWIYWNMIWKLEEGFGVRWHNGRRISRFIWRNKKILQRSIFITRKEIIKAWKRLKAFSEDCRIEDPLKL